MHNLETARCMWYRRLLDWNSLHWTRQRFNVRHELQETRRQNIEPVLRLYPRCAVSDVVAVVVDPHITSFGTEPSGFAPVSSPGIFNQPGVFGIIPANQCDVMI